ncbi:conjugate transposon protein (plasmid) [Fibrisoma limi BUZ 3]|uniref:Conjugate transposon protein n=1 Tax=Fibrisoma limi BUZ 3 TaxID=1185876 RepID=I2GU02_9BACT|nr:conjugative transposon protein TraN [Fibrisoma limi]CCH57603.1 conjugate transposon protein [Fibrisoma limi BUZ 3]
MKNVIHITTLSVAVNLAAFAQQAPETTKPAITNKTSAQMLRLDSLKKRVTNPNIPPPASSPIPENAGVSSAGDVPSPTAVFSYGSIPIQDRNVVRSYYIELAYNKTTCVIFKSPIRSVDLGSKDIIADKANAVDNVLRVKASLIGFNETNFSVMTADGQFYSFVVNYNEYPTMLALDLSVNDDGVVQHKARSINQKGTVVSFAGVNTSQQEIVQNCAYIIDQRRRIKHVGINKYDVEANLRGLYYKDNVLYYKIAIKNKSNLNYDLDYIRFFIVDKTVAKETSHQELEVVPLYVYNQPLVVIPGQNTVEKVFAFQKFTIPDDKVVQVILGEKNGGRTISFTMGNQDILNADTL